MQLMSNESVAYNYIDWLCFKRTKKTQHLIVHQIKGLLTDGVNKNGQRFDFYANFMSSISKYITFFYICNKFDTNKRTETFNGLYKLLIPTCKCVSIWILLNTHKSIKHIPTIPYILWKKILSRKKRNKRTLMSKAQTLILLQPSTIYFFNAPDRTLRMKLSWHIGIVSVIRWLYVYWL